MPVSENNTETVLRVLEAAEANLSKAERILATIEARIPQGVSFEGDDEGYDNARRSFADLLAALPAIDGFRIEDSTLPLNLIAQMRLDAMQEDEIEVHISTEERIGQARQDLSEWRYRFERKRRHLVRDAIRGHMREIDSILSRVDLDVFPAEERGKAMPDSVLEPLRTAVSKIESLLGSSTKRPPRWSDLRRHLSFGQVADLFDIVKMDWPTSSAALESLLYHDDEPVPVSVVDLGQLGPLTAASSIPSGLNWARLSDSDFERLIFALLATESGYRNAQWLQRTRAPDGGRDISVERIVEDNLGGTQVQRIIVQCKHWQTRSLGAADVGTTRDQMSLWEPPRVDRLVIATSGRFSADAIRLIESHNQSDRALRIEMWPDSHLEMLLARRPGFIAEFHLR